jgi:hypothetical protein
MPKHEMNLLERDMADAVYQSMQNAANGTERSAQQQDFRLGISNLGHCRQYAALMTKQVPFSDERDKTAAFIGTVLGAAIEKQMKIDHPDWLFQHEVDLVLPNGAAVPGHLDVCIPATAGATMEELEAAAEEGYDGPPMFPQGIWDLKSKDQLDAIQRQGVNQQQRWQKHGYAKGMIDLGYLDASQPIWLGNVFFDRSGSTDHCFAIGEWYDPAVIDDINEWVNDVTYAVINNEDAPRDKERDFCMEWCEYASVCRGTDTDVQGLITDDEYVTAVRMYVEGRDLESEGKRLKDSAKKVINNRSGSTGEYLVRCTWINPTFIEGFERAGSYRIDVRKPAAPKKGKKK